MFFMKGHGTQAVNSTDMEPYGKGKAMSAEDACGYAYGEYPKKPQTGDFRYHFINAPDADPDAEAMTAKLDALAEATIQHDPKTARIRRSRPYSPTWVSLLTTTSLPILTVKAAFQ